MFCAYLRFVSQLDISYGVSASSELQSSLPFVITEQVAVSDAVKPVKTYSETVGSVITSVVEPLTSFTPPNEVVGFVQLIFTCVAVVDPSFSTWATAIISGTVKHQAQHISFHSKTTSDRLAAANFG